MKRSIELVTILALLLLVSVSPVLAQEQSIPPPVGLRPDAPTYALHGPYWVGTQRFSVDDGDNPLNLQVWYPALNPSGDAEQITYTAHWKIAGVYPELTSAISGHALLAAPPDRADAPYPIIVFSHGFSTEAINYGWLVEHLASYGFIVLAPDHPELFDDAYTDMWRTTIERPQAIHLALDYAETLNAMSGEFEGIIDMDHVAVVGQSYGGYTALAAAGARYDMSTYQERCSALPADDPNQFLCVILPYQQEMTALAGLDEVPQTLWPSMGDSRIDTIVTIAGDSYMFDAAGLAEITIPVLAMGGTLDTATPYDWGVRPTYDDISSQAKILVSFENADHFMALSSCVDQPSIVDEMGMYFFCSDPVWDMSRAHDLLNHFTVAFLMDELKGDQEAAAVLAPDMVNFNGIRYEAQGF